MPPEAWAAFIAEFGDDILIIALGIYVYIQFNK